MLKKILPCFIVLAFIHSSYAQMPGIGSMGGGSRGAKSKVGHFYGKVIDSVTGKAVPFAAIQITGPQWDTATKTLKTAALEGQLTGDNGEFSFDKLPVMGTFTIQINALGYRNYSETVFFDLSKLMKNGKNIQSQSNSDNPDLNSIASAINAIDKDLGNIKISSDATQIKAVTVNGEAPPMELKLDKRVFDVSKSLTTTGGTAEDVLKTIPAVNVDIDGNVSLRNASPTIYVDGLPTTLTIDQIPADEIDKIEVITNPSAKFDASAGSGGIINIIMKHNQALGYNGSIRAGIDQYGKYNAGFDFNLRQGKINWFLNLHYHQVKRIMYGSETRDTVAGESSSLPYLTNTQKDTNTMNGYFGFVRTGFDYFIDNRNTITVSGTYGTGNFNVTDLLHTNTDTVRDAIGNEPISNTYENSSSNRVFNNTGLSLLYKHLFPKEDENITASITANEGSSTGNGTFDIYNYDNVFNPVSSSIEQQISGGTNYYYVGKLDFSDPLSKKIKLESGLMATINDVTSNNTITIDGETNQGESTDYTFNEQVYAAYFTFSHDLTSKLSYQLALRVEQSLYSGNETNALSSTPLNTQSLLKPFPGGFIVYHLTDKSDLQLSYTTHITRPSFSQLVVNNYSNPLAIQIANPNLLPAYQNSFELNYMHTFNKRSSLLISAYYKQTEDVIASQSLTPVHSDTVGEEYRNTYANANYSYSEGAEATAQFSPTSWLDVTANYNLYESGINATNLNIPDTTKPYLSYFAKLNLTFKLPKNFTIQLNGSYQSKTQVPIGGGGGGRWGGGGGGGITPSATGYIIPTYSLDAAVKKEFLKNNKASITFNVRDIFATAVNGTYSTATVQEGDEQVPLYYQTTNRHNLAPYFSINFSFRFGQMDVSIFKHKNNNIDMPPDTGGGDTGGGN
jgi:outer membrane receptor for ferrienterochelin and colicin